ncbi:MAG: DNA-binding protein [Oscillospiraceae bacterium]
MNTLPKDLTNSQLDRQNILNNDIAIEEIRKASKIECVLFEGKLYFTKYMLAEFFAVDVRTIERCMRDNADELLHNGYELIKGRRLKAFIQLINADAPDIDVGSISIKTSQLAIFDFKAFLNIAMLLTESENARVLRQLMLDIVIDLINQKTGGGTKYINQRDKDFVGAYLQEGNYRKEFTDALKDYVAMGNIKYSLFTDMIYQSIFKEKSREYRAILKLQSKDSVRDTLYSEVLDIIAAYECGLAALIKEQSEQLHRQLTNWEMTDIFTSFESLPLWKPLIFRARTKMASRDLVLRDAFHAQLEEYIRPMEAEEYRRFLGSEGDEIDKLMQENRAVLKRLKERE